jgi:hypothetical protein
MAVVASVRPDPTRPDPTGPGAALAALDQVRPRMVVWLNETQEYLGTIGDDAERVAAKLRALLADRATNAFQRPRGRNRDNAPVAPDPPVPGQDGRPVGATLRADGAALRAPRLWLHHHAPAGAARRGCCASGCTTATTPWASTLPRHRPGRAEKPAGQQPNRDSGAPQVGVIGSPRGWLPRKATDQQAARTELCDVTDRDWPVMIRCAGLVTMRNVDLTLGKDRYVDLHSYGRGRRRKRAAIAVWLVA